MRVLEPAMEEEQSLETAIVSFLADLEHSKRSRHTRSAYVSNLAAFHK